MVENYDNLFNQFFPNLSVEYKDQMRYVVDYLLNYLSGSTPDYLFRILQKTDVNIINSMSSLTQVYNLSKPAIDRLSAQISGLQTKIEKRDDEINRLKGALDQKNLILTRLTNKRQEYNLTEMPIISSVGELEKNRYSEILKSLISASYNPRLYLIVQEIYRYWIKNQKMVLRSEIQKTVGQDRPNASFKIAFEEKEKATKTAALIHQLILQENRENKIWVKPSLLGLKVMSHGELFYSKESVNNRLMYAVEYNVINKTRLLLLKSLLTANNHYTNSLTDRKKLAGHCNIIPENIGKYIREFVQMGVIKRIPNEFGNRSHNLVLFDNELVRILVEPELKKLF